MRRGPLRRGKPPQARTALTRKTPLVDRSGGPKRTPFRPSKPTVTAAERSARKVVTARADGCCEGCGRPGPTDYSHRIGAGVGGPWHPANALALDRACHQWLHANPTKARLQRGWRLQSTDNFLTFPAWVYGLGWVLIDEAGEYVPVRDIPEEITA